MANGNEIGAKIVLTGDAASARAAVQGTTEDVGKLDTAASQARNSTGQFAKGAQDMGQAVQAAGGAAGGSLGELKGSLVGLAGSLPGVGGALSGAIGGATSAFGQLSGVASAAASGPLAAVTATVGAITAAFGIAEKSLDAFAGKQDRVTKLDAALAQQGELTDAYRTKLQQLAGEYGRATGQGGAWVDALARLTQFGADSTNIDKYAAAVENLSGLMGGNTERAAQIFSRAMNGNVAALSRYGIEVDKSKDHSGQLDEAMAQLAQRGGGQLAAQTNTLHGQFRQFNGAVGALFSGLGNLISQSGVVQAALGALTTVVRGVASVFPKTVEEVDGLTNKLPPLRDAAGHVKGAVEEMGEGLEDMGSAAEGSAEGLAASGAAAGKAKDKYEEATEALKKLREQQDSFADAKTGLALANIDAAAENGDISKAKADRQRAKVRADAEQAKLDREAQEQRGIIDVQAGKRNTAQTNANVAGITRGNRESDFAAAARAVSSDPNAVADATETAAASERQGKDIFAENAKDLRRNAEAQRANALDAGKREGGQGGFVNTAEIEHYKAEAEAADRQAAALEKLSAQYKALRDARGIEATAAKAAADVQKAASQEIADAEQKLGVNQVQRQKATVAAGTEQTRLRKEQQKKDLDEQQKLLENDLNKHALPDADVAAKQAQFAQNQRALNALQFGGDKAGLAVANATAPVPPGAEQNVKLRDQLIKEIDETLKDVPGLSADQRGQLNRRRNQLEDATAADKERGDSGVLRNAQDFNRRREQGSRDDASFKTPADAAVNEANDAARLTGGLSAQPGTTSAAAVDAVNKAAAVVRGDKGGNADDNQTLAKAINSLLDTLAGKNSPSRSEFAALVQKVDRTNAQIKNARSL